MKLLWFQVQGITTQHFQVHNGPKSLKRMAKKSEKDCLTPSKHSRVCAEHFMEDSFEQNIAERSFVGTPFQASSFCTQERRGTADFQLPYGKLQGGNCTKNNE